MSDPTEPSLSLQDELRRLEEIVRKLEANDLDLDAALELFEEGIGRLRSARERLTDAEVRIQRVLERADGTLVLRTMKE
ncbi:MAG: exodeoxyribonuclease VII small subunit [Gemmatimonadota bacterium]